jgi:NADP-dependent 3-hydroxy acid dehydrogenase YdfG
MPIRDISATTALVTGASRGFGRAIATALIGSGVQVVGVARDRDRLLDVRDHLGESFTAVVADATDPVIAGQLLDKYHPRTLVLNAGASPLSRPLHHHSWDSFSANWDVDVKQVFHWTREALLLPLDPTSTVIAMSSGAAIKGSPLSGGYAGAKATIRFISSYAAVEADRAGLDIRFLSVLPQLTPATDLGATGVAAYAQRQGTDVAGFLRNFGPTLTPEQAGKSVLGLAVDTDYDQNGYMLTADGLTAIG